MKRKSAFIIIIAIMMMLVGCVKVKREDDDWKEYSKLTYEEVVKKVMDESLEEESIKNSLLTIGENSYRVTKLMEKLGNNEEVKIAYLGGSITEGYKVSNKECYTYKTTEKIKETFNNQNVTMINAGLSGTSSTIGLLRVNEDVLLYNPDIIVIEFAVNDGQDEVNRLAFESLIKKCLLSDNEPVVILLFTVLENGYTCENTMKEIGESYGLPMISVNTSLELQLREGTLIWSDYAYDEAHPTNHGHTMISQYLSHYFSCSKKVYDIGFRGEVKDYTGYSPIGSKFYKVAFYNSTNFQPESLGSFVNGNSNIEHFPNGWINSKDKTGTMKFTMKGKDLFILYKEDNDNALADLQVFCDGKLIKVINGNVENGWNNPQVSLVLNLDNVEEHEISINISEETKGENFHILGFGTTGALNGSFHQSEKEMEEANIPYAEKAIINGGNTSRLEAVFKRALEGEDIVIGYIGGSITQGTGSNSQENSYVGLMNQWWSETFKDSKITFINAGIDATTSQFACARVEEDLLSYDPDFVIVEFSVNDENSPLFKDSYESLINMMIREESKPAVMVLNAVQFDTGYNVQELHNKIALYYDLPIISMKNSIFKEIQLGRLEASKVSVDMLHPNNKGHKLMAEIVTNYLNKVLNNEYLKSEKYVIPKASGNLVGINTKRYDNRNTSASLNNFKVDDREKSSVTDIFKNGWVATEMKSSILFFVSGSRISLQYRKTNLMAAPKGIVIIDGDEKNAIEIDGNYLNGWGDWLYLQTVYEGNAMEHTVEIRLTEDGKNEFYLASIITTE